MKQKVLLFTAFAGILYLTLLSKDQGPGNEISENRTGGPGSSGKTCTEGSCHPGAGGLTTGSFTFRKKSLGVTSAPVTQYTPGEDYYVTVKVTNSNSDQDRFGFQLEAVNGTGNSVGTFSGLPSNLHSVILGGRTLIEHSLPLTKSGASDSISFEWKAPTPTVGNVTFHGIILSSDGAGTPNLDQPTSPLATVFGDPAGVPQVAESAVFKAYPNPCTNALYVNTNSLQVSIAVYDLKGVCVVEQKNVAGMNTAILNTSSWSTGVYMVKITNEAVQKIVPVIKQ